MNIRITCTATLLLSIALFSSCEKEKTELSVVLDDQVKGITINEFVAKGSSFQNQFGEEADWFELYNANDSDFILEANRWHCTDNFDKLTQFTIDQDIVISGNSHLVIWADGFNMIDSNAIHTNFKLDNEGEQIILSYTDDAGKIRIVDYRSFGTIQENNKSFGRLPDGSNNWTALETPTPNGFN